MEVLAKAATQSHNAGHRKKRSSIIGNDKGHDLFSTILASDTLDPSDKKAARVAQEGFTSIVAGSETTGRILTTAAYYLLACRDRVLPRLQQELRLVMSNPDSQASLKDLENLPWLVSQPSPMTL